MQFKINIKIYRKKECINMERVINILSIMFKNM